MNTKTLSIIAFLGMGSLFVSACGDEDEEETTLSYNVTLSGSKEVPSNTSKSTGKLTATYNKSTNEFVYKVEWSLEADTSKVAAMHLHGPALETENASPLIGITIPDASKVKAGSISGTGKLTDEQETLLLAGKVYLNIHSNRFPAGEIRGQVK